MNETVRYPFGFFVGLFQSGIRPECVVTFLMSGIPGVISRVIAQGGETRKRNRFLTRRYRPSVNATSLNSSH